MQTIAAFSVVAVCVVIRWAGCFGTFTVSEVTLSATVGKDVEIGSMGTADYFEYSTGAKVYGFAPNDGNPIKLFDKTMDTLVAVPWNPDNLKSSLLLRDPLLVFAFASTPKKILKRTLTFQAFPAYWSVADVEIFTAAATFKSMVGARSGYLYLLNDAGGNSIIKLDPANPSGATVHSIAAQISAYSFASFSAAAPKMLVFSELGNAARIDTAISLGVFAPMSSPTGPRRRSTSSCVTSNSSSLSRRLSLLRFDPSAPT